MAKERFFTKAVLRVVKPEGAERGATREYLVHQLVADLFSDQPGRGYLYRVTEERPGGVEVLVLSGEAPGAAAARPVRDWGCALSVTSKPFEPKLVANQLLDFEIRVNATTSVAGRRKDVWDAVFAENRDDPRSPSEVYQSFLARRLEGAADALSAHVTERGFVSLRRKLGKQRAITFVSSNLVGTLRVKDPDRFIQVVSDGLGRAKGFGHGLLCMSRPGSILVRSSSHATTQE